MSRPGPLAGSVLLAAVVLGVSHLVPTALELTGPGIVVWKGSRRGAVRRVAADRV